MTKSVMPLRKGRLKWRRTGGSSCGSRNHHSLWKLLRQGRRPDGRRHVGYNWYLIEAIRVNAFKNDGL
ncbi:hypothetical protein U1Q18_035699, partial [Sarracenia purpurea var. burkii]